MTLPFGAKRIISARLPLIKIKNARRLTRQSGLVQEDIFVEADLIVAAPTDTGRAAAAQEEIDAAGLIVSPGWIDLQINGGFGLDFTTDPASVWDVATKLPRFGITGFLPTIITAPAETYQTAIATLKSGPPEGWRGARPFGWHFEGPFLNPAKKGAHNPAFLLPPEIDFVQDWKRENGVRLVTMAPELPGAMAVAARLTAHGVVLSIGHSTASLEQASQAADGGFRAATHLFNAMPPLDHRAPGLVGQVLLDERISAGLIADGLHVHPTLVEMIWRLKGPDKILLVSDATGYVGSPPGKYVQGGLEIFVDERSARLADGTLAGSMLRLDQALRNVMRFTGAPLEQVLPALGASQARLLSLAPYGDIRPGFKADLTFLNDAGGLEMTMVGGKLLFP
jgi:N-acetylglucosamine-6-phosphate deacetylase